MNITNESRLTAMQEYLKSYKQFLDEDNVDFNPFVAIYDDRSKQALALFMTPMFGEDMSTEEKAMIQMPPLTMAPLLDSVAISFTHDVWFMKQECDQKDEDGHECSIEEHSDEFNGKRVSEQLERKQGLMTILLDKTDNGFTTVQEYGRDDNGEMYWSGSELMPIKSDEDTLQSWMIPLISKTLATPNELPVEFFGETTDEDKVKAIMTGLTIMDDLGYQTALRPDFLEVMREMYGEHAEMVAEYIDNLPMPEEE